MHRFQMKLLLASMTWVAASNCSVSASESIGDLKDSFPRYSLDERMRGDVFLTSTTVYDVVLQVISRSKLPIGFEEKRGEEQQYERRDSRKRFNYSVGNLTLRGALDLIVQNDPDYKWEEANGTINIVPLKSLLDLRIVSFSASNTDIYSAAEVLAKQIPQADYKQALNSNIPKTTFADYRSDGPRLNINLINKTLRECLNELARQDKYHDWQFHYRSKTSSRLFDIVFRPRNSGMAAANKKAGERHLREREEKLLREGFIKTKGGAWVKPMPGGKRSAPDAPKGQEGRKEPGLKGIK